MGDASALGAVMTRLVTVCLLVALSIPSQVAAQVSPADADSIVRAITAEVTHATPVETDSILRAIFDEVYGNWGIKYKVDPMTDVDESKMLTFSVGDGTSAFSFGCSALTLHAGLSVVDRVSLKPGATVQYRVDQDPPSIPREWPTHPQSASNLRAPLDVGISLFIAAENGEKLVLRVWYLDREAFTHTYSLIGLAEASEHLGCLQGLYETGRWGG